jgi:biopolymer transport protein ExbD
LKIEKDKNNVSILAFDDVPSERIKKVKFEINNIPDIRISTTIVKLVETDVESISFKVLLKENGDIFLNDEKYFLPEFEHKINQLANNLKTASSKGYVFEIENNTSYMQVETVKEILRKAKFVQVQQEIKHHSVSELTPFADNTQTVNAVGLSFNGPLTRKVLDQLMSSSKHYLKKPNTIEAIIYKKPDNTENDIEILKKELLKAGFKKVTVETKG